MRPNSGWNIELEQLLPGQVLESMLLNKKESEVGAGLIPKVPIMQLYRCLSLVCVVVIFQY